MYKTHGANRDKRTLVCAIRLVRRSRAPRTMDEEQIHSTNSSVSSEMVDNVNMGLGIRSGGSGTAIPIWHIFLIFTLTRSIEPQYSSS